LLRGRCGGSSNALPQKPFRVSGIADFPLDSHGTLRAAVELTDYFAACAIEGDDRVDILLVQSSSAAGPDAALAAILEARPDLFALTNEKMTQRVQRTDFSYFRQISFVLTTITLFFSFMLVTTLLSVSINQRFAEIAALRALGFTRQRVVLDLVCESGLLVGSGSLLAIPLGGLLAVWLDGILRGIPGIPTKLEFFVFEPRTLLLHGALFAVTALLATAYPIYLTIRLPIAATLRNEVVS
jgi:ABC-type lipoprotein release transport system permease subunit